MSGIYFNPFDGKFITLPQKIGKTDSPTFAGMEIAGDLTVSGNVVAVQDLEVIDKTITIAFGAPSGVEANGGGVVIDGANIEFLYNNTETAMTLNSNFNPSIDAAFDIGSSTLRWSDAWFNTFNTSDVSITSNTVTTTSTTPTVIMSVDATDFRSGKFVLQAVSSGESHVTEVLVTHNGTNASFTEYGIIYTDEPLFDVTADIDGGNLRLLVTSTSTETTEYHLLENLIFS